MKAHHTTLLARMIRAGIRLNHTRYRVIAAGIDHRDRIINISTNLPRLETRGWHAEERVMYRCPQSLVRIVLARVNRKGDLLPIDPCMKCRELARKKGIVIERIGNVL